MKESAEVEREARAPKRIFALIGPQEDEDPFRDSII